MFLGMGVVAAGLAAFYLVQMRVHKNDKQNCEQDILVWRSCLHITNASQGSFVTESHPVTKPSWLPSRALKPSAPVYSSQRVAPLRCRCLGTKISVPGASGRQ